MTFVYFLPAFPSLGPFQPNKFQAPIEPNGARKQCQSQPADPTTERKGKSRLCYNFLLKNLGAPVMA